MNFKESFIYNLVAPKLLANVNEVLIKIITIVLLAGFPISVITGIKLHYFLFILIGLIILIINVSKHWNNIKFLYFFSLAIPVLHFVATNAINISFIYSLLTYIVIPLIYFSKNFQTFKVSIFDKPFQIFSVIFLVGLLLQIMGMESQFLYAELTYTDGVLHDRYGSLAGGSLALGFTASIATIFSFFNVIYNKKRDPFTLGMLFLSLLTLILAQSRRFYFFIFVIIVLMFLFNSKKKYDVRKILKTFLISILIIGTLIIVLFYFREKNYYVNRFFSAFDFSGDASNALRVLMWVKAFNAFLNNFWFGMGLGATTSVGKDIWDTITAVEDLFVAESYFLKNLVDGGIFFGATFIIISFKFCIKSFKILRSNLNKNSILAAYLFLFFFLDSFISTSLESVVSSLMFWICLAIIQREDKNAKAI